MNEFKHLDRIDTYLEGNMSDSERESFELELEQNEVLREEFEACQAAQKAASFMAFKGMMERIRQEPHLTPPMEMKGMNWKRMLFLAIAALLSAALTWILFPPEKTNTHKPLQTVPSDSIRLQETSPPTDTGSPRENILNKYRKQNNAPVTNKKEKHFAQANLSDFAPNASGDAYLALRSGGDSEVVISSPFDDTDFALDKSGEAFVRFAGTIAGNPNLETVGNSIAIYNNKNVNKPLVTIPLDLKKDAAGVLSFDEQQRLKYPAGLYYFRIKSINGEMVYAGRFTIGKNGN